MAAVGLGVVFEQEQTAATTDVGNALGHGAATVEVDKHQGTRARRDGLFYQTVVDFERLDIRLHEYRLQAIFGDGEDGSYVGIGRHEHLVALVEYTYYNIRAQDEGQGIEAVGHPYAVARANVAGIFLFEKAGLFALQIPTAVDHTVDSLVNLVGMHGRDAFQRQIFNHNVHS